MDRKLHDLGAVPFIPKALADEATGYVEPKMTTLLSLIRLEATIDPWIEKLLQAVSELSTTSSGLVPSPDTKESAAPAVENTTKAVSGDNPIKIDQKIESALSADFASLSVAEEETPIPLKLNDEEIRAVSQLTGLAKLSPAYIDLTEVEVDSSLRDHPLYSSSKVNDDPFSYSSNNPIKLRVKSASCISGQLALERVLELGIELSPLSSWDYVPGDAIGILCCNEDKIIIPLLRRMGLNPSKTFTLSEKESNSSLPFQSDSPITFYQAFKWLFDLHTLPKKALFRVLAEYTSDEFERKKLLFLSSTQGLSERLSVCVLIK